MSERPAADALVDVARGVADLEAEVPQEVEHVLDDALAPGGLLVGQQEQEIDIGAGRQHAAAVAADRHHRHALGGVTDCRLVHPVAVVKMYGGSAGPGHRRKVSRAAVPRHRPAVPPPRAAWLPQIHE